MSYMIRSSSEQAKQMFAPVVTNQEPLPLRIGKEYPFNSLMIGQSFFLKFNETLPYVRILAKERISRYNKKYAVYFVTVKHSDALEVARIA